MRLRSAPSVVAVVSLLILCAVHESRAFVPSSSVVSTPGRQLLSNSPVRIAQRTKPFTFSVEKEEPQGVGAATFSLIKAIVGSGALAMPAGLAASTDAPKAVIPASLFVMFMGCLSAYTFYILGRMCDQDNAESLTDLWKKYIGKGSGLVTMSILFFTLGAALTYSICLGDTFSSLAQTVGLTGWMTWRQTSILAVTITALWPLCNIKNLAALAPFSIVGVVGTLVTCLFMIIRCVQPSGPYRLPNGTFLSTLAPTMLPEFGTRGIGNLLSPSALVLASMCNCAFICHYSASDFLQVFGHNSGSSRLSKYKKLVLFGFSSVFAINAVTLIFGFLTFGGNCSGLVLNNYSTLDIGATLSRLFIALSVIGGFPFLINASRQTFFELQNDNSGKKISKESKRKVTRGLVSLITGLSLVLEDAGVVVSFNGAVMGSAIIFIFPALLFLNSTKEKLASGALELTKKVKLERNMCRFLVGFGAMGSVVGGAVTIISKYFPHLLR